ncbi:MAG: hypothetical protein Q7R52_01810 [archaeon]|nr:hypothetical protein [archaeon]
MEIIETIEFQIPIQLDIRIILNRDFVKTETDYKNIKNELNNLIYDFVCKKKECKGFTRA